MRAFDYAVIDKGLLSACHDRSLLLAALACEGTVRVQGWGLDTVRGGDWTEACIILSMHYDQPSQGTRGAPAKRGSSIGVYKLHA